MTYTVYERTTADQRTELVYVHQGIGEGAWMAFYRSLSGGMHRIKSVSESATKDEAQEKLDAYAAKKGWSVATTYESAGNGGFVQRPWTWEEAARI